MTLTPEKINRLRSLEKEAHENGGLFAGPIAIAMLREIPALLDAAEERDTLQNQLNYTAKAAVDFEFEMCEAKTECDRLTGEVERLHRDMRDIQNQALTGEEE